jgi:methylphosphotriester-DNA--protein-cysteine methyltransferase
MQLTRETYQRIRTASLYMDGQQAGFSCFPKHRLFTLVYHTTAHHYGASIRQDAAKSLLQKENSSIAQVYKKAGFEGGG